jgi:hypothetical protein
VRERDPLFESAPSSAIILSGVFRLICLKIAPLSLCGIEREGQPISELAEAIGHDVGTNDIAECLCVRYVDSSKLRSTTTRGRDPGEQETFGCRDMWLSG